MYHHTHTPPTYEQADRQTKCITTPTLPTHEQADRQTKCITTLSHHPFTHSRTHKMYHHLVNRQADRQNVLPYSHITKSQTDTETDRLVDKMYYCTHTSPTCEQSDRQTKYGSLYSHGPSDSLNDLNGGLPAGQVGCMHADPCAGANCRKNGHTKNLPGLVKVHHQPITQTRLIDCTLSGQGYTN